MVLGLTAVFVHPMPQLLPTGSPAPPIRLLDASGATVTAVPSAAHHPVVVIFLETACVTCEQTAPGLCAIRDREPEVDVVIVDSGGTDPAAARDFARRYLSGCDVPFLLDPGLAVSRSYAVSVVPIAYVVDAHGNISYSGTGAGGVDGVLPHLEHTPGG